MKKFYILLQAFFVTVLAIGVLTAFNSAFAEDGDDDGGEMIDGGGMMSDEKYDEDEAFDAMMEHDEDEMMGDEGAMMDEDDFEKMNEMLGEEFLDEEFKEMRKKMKEEMGEHFQKFDLEGEIAFMEEQLGMLKSVFESLKDADDERLQSAIEKLSALADEGGKLLTKMKEVIVDSKVTDETLIEDAWEMMDKLGEEAREYMEVLREYFEENEDALEALSEDQREGLKQMMKEEGGEGHGRGRGEAGMDFEKLYEGFDLKGLDKADFMKGIKEEMLNEVMRKVNGILLEKLAPYLEEEVIADVLNSLDFLDEDILASSVLAYEEADGIDGMDKDFQEMRKMMKDMVIDEEVAGKLKTRWSEVKDAVDKKDGGALKSLKEEIKKLLEENRERVFRGEDAFLFEDLPLDHWSMEDVFELREEGVIDGYRDKDGNLLGEYGPSDNVTIAELSKMAIEASGDSVEALGEEGSGVVENMHWAEKAGYVAYAEEIGLDKLVGFRDLNKAATREEAAIIIAKIFEYDTDREWRDAFKDYKGEFKGYVQAVYDEGVFTGQGETGEFDGESNLNRAEVAKVIRAASEDQGFVMDMDEFIERLDEEVDLKIEVKVGE